VIGLEIDSIEVAGSGPVDHMFDEQSPDAFSAVQRVDVETLDPQ